MKSRSLFLVALILAGLLPTWAWALSYSTSFPSNENPISQSGVWVNGGATGLDWTNVAVTAGLAHGTQTGTAFPPTNDSVASLQAMGAWGPDQTVQATVRTLAHAGTNVFEEAELFLRFTIAAHAVSGYEVLFSTNGNRYCQIVRWNGALNDFTLLEATSCTVSNGDTLKATILGTVITQYVNGIVVQSHDTLGDTGPRYSTGSPGIGFYFQTDGTGGSNGETGFTSYGADDGTSTSTTTMTVAKTGAGTGTVTSTTPSGTINCGGDCTETVVSGTVITLTASASVGSAFSGWSGGGCSGAGTCSVTLTADTTVIADFALPNFQLTVTKVGSGTGTVSGGGINCGPTCSESLLSGTAVLLDAAPDSADYFVGWSGGGCSGTGGCSVTLTSDMTVTASFAPLAVVQFSGANFTVSEGATSATITVVRSPTVSMSVQVHYETGGGTAVAGTDYTHTEGELVFSPGQTTKTFTVPVMNTTRMDGPRTVVLYLKSPQGAQLGIQRTAVLTIADNDTSGKVNFSTTSYTAPDKPGMATITVRRSGGAASAVTVQYATGQGGTGIPGTDYVAIDPPLMLTFAANETTKTFQIQILGNAVVGGSKIVPLLLSAPGGGASLGSPSTATLTIRNTDEGGSLRFSASSYTVAEDVGSALITVTRFGGAGGGVSVQIVSVDGTAKLNTDYGPPSVETLTFAANDTSKTLTVPILANPTAANSRALTLALKAPGGGASVVSPSAVALTITKAGIRFSATAYTANEGSTATITVMRKQTTPATVMYRTQDASATAPDDYTAIAPTVLSFASGQTSKTFAVTVLDNLAKTSNRQLQLILSAAAGEALDGPSQATLTILDKQMPDLQLATFAPPPTALVGKPIAVPNTVRNVSAATAAASTLRFVLSANGTLGDTDDVILGARAVGSLAGGATSAATTTLTIPATTAPGTYALFAVVDALNVVAEQDETNNVGQALVTVVASIPKTFGLSGDLTRSACTSALRDGQLAAQATLARSNQTGTSLTGTLAITFPLASGLKISGPVQATVSPDGSLGGTFAYKMTQGSTTLATGTGTLGGSVNAAATTMSLVLTGTHATGETCDFTADLEGPVTPIGFLTFQHDTRVGDLETTDGSFVATPNFPLTIDRNRTLFDVAMDSGFPNPAAVAFVDPNQSASPAATLTQLTPNAAEYAGSWVPATGLAGVWIVHYKGTDYNFLMPDPDAANRLVVPILVFTSIGGSIQQMTWSYASPTGDALNGPPPFMRLIRIQVLDPCGVVLQDSLGLEPTTMSRTLNPPVSMSRIAEIRFQLVDGQGDIVTVHYGEATPGNCQMFEFTAPSYSAPENVTLAHVTVSRVGDLTAGPLTVDFHTSDGTAHAPVDYLDASQTLTFKPGVTTQVVSVPIVNGPTLHAAPTSVLMSLQNPSAGTSVGALGTAILSINDQGPRLRFSAGSYKVSEASAAATITVQRTGAATPVVSVNYATSDGTAVAPDDYQATAGVLTFLAGQTSKTFTVPIGNDLLAEGNQTVNLTLTNPIGGLLGAPATAVLTITDNDTGGTVTFSAAAYSVAADDLVTIGVTRTGGTGGGVTVHYATSDPGGPAGATVGADYDAASGDLTFGPNETTKTFTVQTHGVTVNKAVTLTLSNLFAGASLGNPSTATLWIVAVPSRD